MTTVFLRCSRPLRSYALCLSQRPYLTNCSVIRLKLSFRSFSRSYYVINLHTTCYTIKFYEYVATLYVLIRHFQRSKQPKHICIMKSNLVVLRVICKLVSGIKPRSTETRNICLRAISDITIILCHAKLFVFCVLVYLIIFARQ